MSIYDLIAYYNQGRLTSLGLGTEAVHLIDGDNAATILSALPTEALGHARDLVFHYKLGQMISFGGGGIDPGADRIATAPLV